MKFESAIVKPAKLLAPEIVEHHTSTDTLSSDPPAIGVPTPRTVASKNHDG